MAGSNNGDQDTIRLGEELERLRKARGLTRRLVVNRLLRILDENDPDYMQIGESWLATIEKGRKVKIRREIIEALCKALSCTLSEEAYIFLLADRNVLVASGQMPDGFASLLNEITSLVYREILEIIASIPEDQANGLSLDEKLELISSAFDLVLKKLGSRA